jgi:antitoxin ParD1/3/4
MRTPPHGSRPSRSASDNRRNSLLDTVMPLMSLKTAAGASVVSSCEIPSSRRTRSGRREAGRLVRIFATFHDHNERSLTVMANVKKRSISLTPDLDSVIERWIGSGRYASRSEVIRAALRALEREEEQRTGRPAAFAAKIARQARQNLDVPLVDDPVARLRKKLGFANESGDV